MSSGFTEDEIFAVLCSPCLGRHLERRRGKKGFYSIILQPNILVIIF